MKKNITILILILLFLLGGIETLGTFLSGHSYYYAMFAQKEHRFLILAGIVSVFIPLSTIIFSKKLSLKGFVIALGAGLGLFSILHQRISIAPPSGDFILPLLINIFVLYGVALLSILGIFAIGERVAKSTKLFAQIRRQETLLSFGLGLIIFLYLIQILMGIGLLYTPLICILFIGMISLFFLRRKHYTPYQESLQNLFEQLKKSEKISRTVLFILMLLGLSILYYYFGFFHSYIPYPTAWDANHEYMYIPKIIAENAGILRGNNGPGAGIPFIWHSFITFFFSLGKAINPLTNISADSLAINLNFLSGIFVLVFGLGAIKEALDCITPQEEKKSPLPFLIGWTLLLLRLTSGTGAFLVFVDNKTDLGVMAITTLAIMAGCMFIKQFKKTNQLNKKNITYLLLCSLFFIFSVLAKPTAFIDIVIFGLLISGLWINTLTALGGGITMLGILGIIQPLYTSMFISPSAGKLLLLVGLITTAGGLWYAFIKKEKIWNPIKTILLRWTTILLGLLLLRGPWTLVGQIIRGDIQAKQLFSQTLLGFQKNEKKEKKARLFADIEDPLAIERQNSIDEEIIQQTPSLSQQSCSKISYSDKELEEGKKEGFWSTLHEDFGRYIWFGRKSFKTKKINKEDNIGIGEKFLALLFGNTQNTCYSISKDAKILCKHEAEINSLNLPLLDKLYQEELNKNSKTAQFLKALLEKQQSLKNHSNPEELKEALRKEQQELLTHISENSIKTTDNSVEIPFRYLIPLNTIFNWSLQNPSSYYTDVGIYLFFCFVLLLVGIIYCLIARQRKKLTFLLATLLGRIIWWAIASGILRYGLGLLLWTAISISIILEGLSEKEKKNQIYFTILMIIFWGFLFIQMLLNFVRIASQAGISHEPIPETERSSSQKKQMLNAQQRQKEIFEETQQIIPLPEFKRVSSRNPFWWYKSNRGREESYSRDNQGNPRKETKTLKPYTAEDIFKLQFWHYIPFLEYVKDRKNEEGVLVAGTYLQYFLHNARNVRNDGMLSWLWRELSDEDSCKSSQRLKKEKIKYLVIDPNIGTVGREGQGNQSLFQRFFGKLNQENNKILQQGVITMLIKMQEEGYIKLIYSNNLGAKYALSYSDKVLQQILGDQLSKEEIQIIKAKMMVAKFFYDDQMMLNTIANIFQHRILNGKDGIEDIANIFWKEIDGEKLIHYVSMIQEKQRIDPKDITEDELGVINNFLAFHQAISSGQAEKIQPLMREVFKNSIFGGSQIIALELI